ncbi:MAG: COX15/CtaA family protein, partial [Vitreimonas sp.]
MSSEDIWPPRERWVGIWLVVICALVIVMILVGGATRLTDSGLSITEWNFMKHVVPPLT